ncbi:class I SAM-dependent methyltransferase [bacterium]|nr:class I SAM-dependent methyltransferase [bacterium]
MFIVDEKLKANYDNYYDGESEWRKITSVCKAANILHLCSAIPHEKILDIGSGEGSVLKRLSDAGFGSLFSLEISESGVDIINNRYIASLKECKIFDGYNIPYNDNQFDLAVISHVLEHVEFPRMLLKEAARVAKYVFIEVPLEDNNRLPKDYKWERLGHINFYSLKTIRRLLQTTNLEILVQEAVNNSLAVYKYQHGKTAIMKFLIKKIMLRMFPSLATRLFTYNGIILCRRSTDL